MLGIDTRAARAVWTAILIALGLWLFYQARTAILIFIFAIFLAYLVAPLVNLVTRFTPKRVSHTWALAIVYLLLITALIAIAFGVVSRIATEASNLAARLPEFARNNSNVNEWPFPPWLEPWKPRIIEFVQSQLQSTSDEALPLLKKAGAGLLSGLGSVGFALLIPILSFFFIMDGTQVRRAIIGYFENGPSRVMVEGIFDDMHILLGQYIRALMILAGATFFFYDIYLSVTGVPYSGLLALAAALLEFIPVIGPLTAMIISLAVAGSAGYPHLGWMLAFFIVYRLFQDYVLQPYLLGSGVALHPLLILFGVLAGEQIGGVLGMFLSVPVLATLRIIFIHSRKAAQE